MKRYIGILLTLALIFSLPAGIYAADNTASGTIILDLEQAYKLLEKNNLEIKLLDKKIEMKINQNDDLTDTIEKVRGLNSTYESTNLQYRKTEQLSYRQATLELDILYNDRKDKLDSLKTNVKKQYIGLLSQQENIEYIKQDIDVMNRKLKETELRVQLGQAMESDYKAMYSQSLSLQNQMNALKTQYDTSMINFKILLGIGLNQAVTIQNYMLPQVTVGKGTLQDDIAKAIENDFSIEKLRRQIDLKSDEAQLVKKYTDAKFSSEYRDLLVELDELKAELAYQKQSLEADLMIEYYNLLVMEDQVKLAKLELEIAQINYDAAMAKAKLGLIDTTTEINARITYNRQRNSTESTMNDYTIAVEQFNQKLDI